MCVPKYYFKPFYPEYQSKMQIRSEQAGQDGIREKFRENGEKTSENVAETLVIRVLYGYNETNGRRQEGSGVEEQFNTMKMNPIVGTGNEAQDILMYVYQALQAKGYDPITQLVGYIISGDPTYITSYNSARSLICRLERDEILEELVRSYMDTH